MAKRAYELTYFTEEKEFLALKFLCKYKLSISSPEWKKKSTKSQNKIQFRLDFLKRTNNRSNVTVEV